MRTTETFSDLDLLSSSAGGGLLQTLTGWSVLSDARSLTRLGAEPPCAFDNLPGVHILIGDVDVGKWSLLI